LIIVATLLIFVYGALYLTAQMYFSWQVKYDEDEGFCHKYVTVFLAYHVLITVLMIGMYTISYALEAVAGIQLIYVVLLFITRPYYLKSQNIMLIICQIFGLLFTILLVLIQYMSISDMYMSYAILGF